MDDKSLFFCGMEEVCHIIVGLTVNYHFGDKKISQAR